MAGVIFAIDPGTFESGHAVLEAGRVLSSGITRNGELLESLRDDPGLDSATLAIEMVASYGMAVGREVFETVWWIGRFTQAWHDPEAVLRVYRKDVKSYLCGSTRAKDANIRQALIDALGPQGTKAKPGPTYGVRSHAWAALAVAVTAEAQLAKRYLPTDIERAAAPKPQAVDPFEALA